MIIKLTDGDVTIAQDSVDDQGIIHIPENVWDHIVQEVQHPDQSFVNELYINVQDLNIQQAYEINEIRLRDLETVPISNVIISDSSTGWFFAANSTSITPAQGVEVLVIKKDGDIWDIKYSWNWPGRNTISIQPNSWVYSNNAAQDCQCCVLNYEKNGNTYQFCTLIDTVQLNNNHARMFIPTNILNFDIPWMTFN